jgi:hypothetical protein
VSSPIKNIPGHRGYSPAFQRWQLNQVKKTVGQSPEERKELKEINKRGLISQIFMAQER